MSDSASNSENIRVKAPKRVLHFSDGILEEYSDEESETKDVIQNPVDPKTLQWIPWFQHYTWQTGSKVLEYCDYLGEGFADLLGITTPKYQLELSEYERIENDKRKEMEEEANSWAKSSNGMIPLVTNPPSSRNDGPSNV